VSEPAAPPRLTAVQWLVCVIASIGFAFDIYELLMGPLVFPPAIEELTGAKRGSDEFLTWVGRLFYIPAFAGGAIGLLGGYLTDRLGRRFVLTWSILLYAFSAFAAGFSTSIEMLLFFRCTTFIGVCVEFVAAVAWLAELFDDPHRRERVLGYTQAFSSVGGLLVAVFNGLAVAWAAGKSYDLVAGLTIPGFQLPAIHLPDWANFFGGEIKNPHAPWRYTLMSGLIPAIPLIVIRPFLPESPKWKQKMDAGTLKRPSFGALFSPELARTTIVTALMFACSYGAAFGAIQQLPQIVPGLQEVKEQTAGKPVPEQKRIEQGAAAGYTKVQEIGGLFGRFILALLVVRIVSRRALLRVFQVPGMFLLPIVFIAFARGSNSPLFSSFTLLHLGIFAVGLLTVAQFSFWGNYLPRVYPLHLRGTGESFAANIGGRMIGTSFAWVTATLAQQSFMPGAQGTAERMALTAAIVGTSVYVVGFLLSFALPEPPEHLDDA
jgi:MFS family permease